MLCLNFVVCLTLSLSETHTSLRQGTYSLRFTVIHCGQGKQFNSITFFFFFSQTHQVKTNTTDLHMWMNALLTSLLQCEEEKEREIMKERYEIQTDKSSRVAVV